MSRIRRLEVWSDLECAGGTRLSFYQPLPIEAVETRELNGRETLKVTVARDVDGWPDVERERVFRTYLEDGSWDEWRIVDVAEARDDQGRTLAQIECESPMYDLGLDVISRTEANGDVQHDFDLYRLTPTEHLQRALTAAPGYFQVGSVEFSERIDVLYRWDTPLSAIRQIIETLTGTAELRVTRVGTTAYRVNIVDRIGSTQPEARLRYQKGLKAISLKQDGRLAYSRIYPKGADLDGWAQDMGPALWEIEQVTGNRIKLKDAPVGFDDQLNGLFVQAESGGTPVAITDTFLATQEVELATTAGLAAGTRVHMRVNIQGDELTYLDRPGQRLRSGPLDRQDIPPVDNVVQNPFLSDWTGGNPDGWSAVGPVTLTEDTDAAYHLLGRASAKITASDVGEGLQSAWARVYPTKASPFFAAQASLYVVRGSVRVELQARDASGKVYTIPDPFTDGVAARTNRTGVWTERLSIVDQAFDFEEKAIIEVRIRVLADAVVSGSGDAEWYLDGVQIVQRPFGDLPYYDGRASNALWHAANEELKKLAAPPTTIEIDVVDLFRLDREQFAFDELVLGGDVKVVDPVLGKVIDTRIVRIERDLIREGVTKVTLSDRPEEIAVTLTEEEGRRRRLPARDGAGEAADSLIPDIVDVLLNEKDAGVEIVVAVNSATASVWGWEREVEGEVKEEDWPVRIDENGIDRIDLERDFELIPPQRKRLITRPPAKSTKLIVVAPVSSSFEFGDAWKLKIKPGGTPFFVPEVGFKVQQVGSTLQAELDLHDPDGRIRETAFIAKTGPGDIDVGDPGAGWTRSLSAPFNLTFSAPLQPKRGTTIFAAIGYEDEDGNTKYIRRQHSGDPDHDAEITSIEITPSQSGTIMATPTGDEDAVGIYVTAQVGSDPADPTPSANDGYTPGRSGRIDTGIPWAGGEQAVVKARAVNSRSVLGPVQKSEAVRGIGTVGGKKIRVHAANFIARDQTQSWAMDGGRYLVPNATVSRLYYAFVPLAPGSIMKTLRARMFRAGGGDTAQVSLSLIDDNGNVQTLGTAVHSGTGWQTATAGLSSTTLAENRVLMAQCNLIAPSNGTDARLLWFEVEYDAPDVHVGI